MAKAKKTKQAKPMKLTVINHSVSESDRATVRKQKLQKAKFKDITIDGLMAYIEKLEARIERLENKEV